MEELTWEDIETIVREADNLANEGMEKWIGDPEGYYTEVLNRLKENTSHSTL